MINSWEKWGFDVLSSDHVKLIQIMISKWGFDVLLSDYVKQIWIIISLFHSLFASVSKP